MKTAVAMVLATTATGCYVHAVEDSRTTRREEVQVTEGALGRDAIELTVTPREVMVTLASSQQCVRQRFVVTETTTDKHAELVEPKGQASSEDDGDGASRSIGLYSTALVYTFAAPVVVVIAAATALATAVEVGIAHPETTRERVLVESHRFPCPAPLPGVSVELTMPSGRVYRGRTGDDGVIAFDLPPDEQPGPIHVRAGALEATAAYGG